MEIERLEEMNRLREGMRGERKGRYGRLNREGKRMMKARDNIEGEHSQ